MKNSKLFAVRAAAALFMALVLCTIAAHRIEILLLTEVRSLAVPAAVTMEDGSTVTKVPAAAVYTGRRSENPASCGCCQGKGYGEGKCT